MRAMAKVTRQELAQPGPLIGQSLFDRPSHRRELRRPLRERPHCLLEVARTPLKSRTLACQREQWIKYISLKGVLKEDSSFFCNPSETD